MMPPYFKVCPVLPLLVLLLLLCSSTRSQNSSGITGLADIGDTKLYYEIKGKGETVVLIHGGLVDSRLWDDQFAALAKRFRVLRYDLRGFGRSDFPSRGFSHVDDLHSLLKHLKISRASLVGLSLGAIIAADFAIAHDEMVEKIVLAAPGLRGVKFVRSELAATIYRIAETGEKDKAIEMWFDHPYFASGKKDRNYVRRTKQMLSDNYKYWGPTPKPIEVNWATPPTAETLSVIDTPVLIIIGDKDEHQILQNAAVLQAKIKGVEKTVMAGVSHHLNMEAPRKFNSILRDFLSRTRRAK